MRTSSLSRIGLPAADDSAAEPSGNRRAVLGVAVLVAVLLAAGAWLLLGGTGDDLEELAAPPPAAAAEPSPTASPEPTPSALRFDDAVPARDGRDPFAALYVEPRTGAQPGGTAAPAAQDPSAQEPAAPAPDAGSGATAAPDAATGALTVALLRTEGSDASRTAVFTVDGTEQPVAVGEGFGPADALLLLSLQQGPAAGGWTAVVQAGQGEPFDVVTGDVVTVP